MRTDEFDYTLPPHLIATEPPTRREESRLLVLRRGEQAPEHRSVAHLPSLLHAGDLLVLNDTRVMPARLLGRRLPGGGETELLLLERDGDDGWTWRCMARPGKKLVSGRRVQFGGAEHGGELEAEIVAEQSDGLKTVRFAWEGARPGGLDGFREALARVGLPPLPPYILAARREREHDERPMRPEDRDRYQTVFARTGESVAAPTAGLHFSDELLAKVEASGVEVRRLRLDVSAGTFKPVDADDPHDHPMHVERFWIPGGTAEAVEKARKAGRRIVCVGTTVVRALEASALASPSGEVTAGEARTRLLILPGEHRWRVADVLLTNFHLPRSTLLMLVCAFRGTAAMLAAYREAVRQGYRFYSYGDAMLLER